MSNNSPQMERVGVSKVQEFFSRCGWLFREQFVSDFGVDAHVEIVHQGEPVGQLLAVQIKAGKSYFQETTPEGYVYRFGERHKDYWLAFSIPVIIVLYNPDSNTLFWEHISKKTVKVAGGNYKVTIPHQQVLTTASLRKLIKISNLPTHILRLNRLYLDRDWIQLVRDGETIYIEFEDWVNKSLPRYNIRIGCSSRKDIREHEWPLMYMPGTDYFEALSCAVPWARFETDEEAYEEYMKSVWDAECYTGYDKEDGIAYYSESFHSWYKPPEGIVPVGADGETESYRLILSLNEIGNAFLELDSFLNEETVYFDPPSQRQRGGS